MVIYDHIGNLVTKTWLADLVPDENVKRAVFNINIGDRRIINKVHKNKDKVIWRSSDTEMINHADTHFLESTFDQYHPLWRSTICLNSSQNMHIIWMYLYAQVLLRWDLIQGKW